VFENVAYPLREHARLSESELRVRVEHLLSLVGLAGSGPVLPPDLSGGMRKRAGIARALALEPELIFYDEPSAGLDPTNARLITDLLLGLRAQGVSNTAMVVTHDLQFARAVSDRIAVLIGGRIAQVGSPADIVASADPLVRAFLAGQAAA
jgi:phospholipid/cholesterol/gamma-HCH transport system ATP-binding protein